MPGILPGPLRPRQARAPSARLQALADGLELVLCRLPTRAALRPLSDYPSKKRAQVARRQALLREGTRQVQAVLSRAARP